MRTLLCLLIAFFGTWSAPALAQAVVSRAIVDGKTVILYDDFSWNYETAKSPGCRVLTKNLSFCAPANRWKQMNQSQNSEVTAFFRYSDNLYAMVIEENLGKKAGVTNEAMVAAVLQSTANAVGISKEEVIVVDSDQVEVKGHAASNIAYTLPLNGLNYTYLNTIIVFDNRTVQLLSYTLGKELKEEHKSIHKAYLSYFEFTSEAEPKEDTDQKDDTELQE